MNKKKNLTNQRKILGLLMLVTFGISIMLALGALQFTTAEASEFASDKSTVIEFRVTADGKTFLTADVDVFLENTASDVKIVVVYELNRAAPLFENDLRSRLSLNAAQRDVDRETALYRQESKNFHTVKNMEFAAAKGFDADSGDYSLTV